MIYQTTYIGGVKFAPRAMYNLDRQKWEREAARRLQKIKADFARNRYNKNFIFNPRNYPLRARPTFTEQKTIWQ